MNRWLAPAALAALVTTSPLAAQHAPPAAERPRIEKKEVQAEGVRVHYLALPWGPATMATMEAPGEGFYNRRSWPFARLESTVPLRFEGTPLEPGNYALVFHPNDAADEGMSLELRKLSIDEFLQEGNAMTPTPEGATVFRAPVRFDTAASTAPSLEIGLSPDAQSVLLTVHYGNRLLQKKLLR